LSSPSALRKIIGYSIVEDRAKLGNQLANLTSSRYGSLNAVEDSTFSPRDLLLASKWSSLLFTTYSLSLSFLEAVALSAVARSVRRLTVLTDIEGYRSPLADSGAVGVGRHYDVIPIKVHHGVFHPKIAVMADEDGTVRATVGSGNLTFGGWGYNTELVDVLIPGPDSKVFEGLADFLQAMTTSAVGARLDVTRAPNLDQYVEQCRTASRSQAREIRVCSTRLPDR
jgi:hypothetical protein